MKKIYLLLPLILVTLTGCGGEKDDAIYHTVSFRSSFKFEEDSYLDLSIDIPYSDSYFSTPGTKFSKKLAFLSYGAALTAVNVEKVDGLLTDFGFSDIYHSNDYYEEERTDSFCYNLAHKKINEDTEILSVIIEGYEYVLPWAENFEIGKTGNAAGFQKHAETAVNAIDEYIAKYNLNNVKIWVSGYSRGAGIANIIGQELFSRDENKIDGNNLYVYAFEAPATIDVENKIECNSIHNVVTSGDIITKLAPAAFGLVRGGNDDYILNNFAPSKVDKIVKNFDNRIVMPEFNAVQGYTSEDSLANFIVDTLTSEIVDDEGNPFPDMSTRENYVDNGYQSALSYLVPTIWGARDILGDKLADLDYGTMLSFLNEDKLYEYLKNVFDESDISYDDELLHDSCNCLVRFVNQNEIQQLLVIALNAKLRDDAIRLVMLHCVEVSSALIAYNFG